MLQGVYVWGVVNSTGLAHSDPWPRVSPCRLIHQVASPAAVRSNSRQPG